jgi:hypothetical protein
VSVTTGPSATQFAKSPKIATLLGVAGLIPFAGTVAGAIYMPEALDLISDLQAVYGSCILSFLGGIHWGIAMQHKGSIIFNRYGL